MSAKVMSLTTALLSPSANLLGEGLRRWRSPGSGEREGQGAGPGPRPRAEPGELQATGCSGDWARLSSSVVGVPTPAWPSCRGPSLALISCIGVAGRWATLWPCVEAKKKLRLTTGSGII